MRRLHRSTKQYIIIVILSLLIIGIAFLAAYFFILRDIEKSYGIKLNALSNELSANRRSVYSTTKEIEAGAVIAEDSIEYKEVYTGQSSETFMNHSDIGKVALVNIPTGVYIQKNMITQENCEDDIRELRYQCVEIPDQIMQNDTIDVRLTYPNGENYIVLAKKAVKFLNEEKTDCYLWLSEEEILLMTSAVVDAYLYSGAYLYATKYIEPSLQTAAVVNYQPSLATQELIRENPNIVEIAQKELSQLLRKSLENRLADSLEADVKEIDWNVNDYTHLNNDQREKNEAKADTGEENKEDQERIGGDYYYYTQEEEAKEKDIEYGE